MPKIIKDDAQETALNRISLLLGEIKAINEFSTAKELAVTCPGKKGKPVEISSKLTSKLVAVLAQEKSIKAKEITDLCKKFRISLDDSEYELMKPKGNSEPAPAAEITQFEGGYSPVAEDTAVNY